MAARRHKVSLQIEIFIALVAILALVVAVTGFVSTAVFFAPTASALVVKSVAYDPPPPWTSDQLVQVTVEIENTAPVPATYEITGSVGFFSKTYTKTIPANSIDVFQESFYPVISRGSFSINIKIIS